MRRARCQPLDDACPVPGVGAAGAVDQEHDLVGAARPLPGGRHHRLVEPAGRLEETGRVDQQDLAGVDDGDAQNPGPGGLHLRRNDADLGADDAVDQGRLADVGRTENGDEAAPPLRLSLRGCRSFVLTGHRGRRLRQQNFRSSAFRAALGGAHCRHRRQAFDAYFDAEHRGVRRAGAIDLPVLRQCPALALRPLLQHGLGVLGRRGMALDQASPQPLDDLACRRIAAIKVHGGNQRLAGVGQQARVLPATGLLLAARQPQAGCQLQILDDLDQGFLADERGVAARQRSHLFAGELVEQQVGDDEAEDSVAQELQPFVGMATAADIALVAGVGQRFFDPARRDEPVADTCLQIQNTLGEIRLSLGHSMVWNRRSKRTVLYHSQTFRASPSTEKKMTRARPIRFSKGM